MIMTTFPADAQVQDFLLDSQGVLNNSSQGLWLQQTSTLFIQSGVQLLSRFLQHTAAWADTSMVRANFSHPTHSQAGQKHGNSHNNFNTEPFVVEIMLHLPSCGETSVCFGFTLTCSHYRRVSTRFPGS